MKFLDPKIDIAFKKIFGSEHHKNLTMNFLNNILNLPATKLIEDITFYETEKQPDRIKGKKVYFDIYCTDKQKNNYIIEIQLLNEYNFIERSEYYIARALMLQLDRGKDYQDLLPVIFVGIVNYHLFDDADDDKNQCISSYSMHNDKTGKPLKKSRLSLNYIELSKFKKTLEQLETVTDRWLYFLKNAKKLDSVPEPLHELQEAFNVLDELKWTHADLQEYSKEQELTDRQRRQQEGSHEEGLKEGLQEGQLQALQKIAMQALKEGLSFDVIEKITGLSAEEIQAIKESM